MEMSLLNDVCRTCNIENDTLLNIFTQEENQTLPTLLHMLEYCTQTELVNNLQYPPGICYKCIKQLEISYRFLKRFHLSQSEFEEAHDYMTREKVKDARTSKNVSDVSNIVAQGDLSRLESDMDSDDNKQLKIKSDGSVEMNLSEQDTEMSEKDVRCQLEQSGPDVTCHICGKSFFTEKALTLHLKINHKQ